MSCEQETAVIPRSDGWADSGPREAQAHPGIHGSYHRYDVIEWFEPSTSEYTADHARPICPVGELASADDGSACRLICERIGVEGGSGAWRCPHHGYFRVFDYPTEEKRETEQATLLADGGRSTDEITHAVTCDNCGAETFAFERDCVNCGVNRWRGNA